MVAGNMTAITGDDDHGDDDEEDDKDDNDDDDDDDDDDSVSSDRGEPAGSARDVFHLRVLATHPVEKPPFPSSRFCNLFPLALSHLVSSECNAVDQVSHRSAGAIKRPRLLRTSIAEVRKATWGRDCF